MLLESWVYWKTKIVKKLFFKFLDCLLIAWKSISPYFLGSCCRFIPSCSEYAVIQIKEKGIFKGSYFALKRLAKCHPLHKSS